MSIASSRTQLESELLAFVWDEWSQMGVFARPQRTSRWAQDPEALIVFTFQVARADPRLFDEVLDWLVRNEHFISVRRLRNLSRDPDDRSLIEAVLTWLSMHRPKARFSSSHEQWDTHEALVPVHSEPNGRRSIQQDDEAFARHGWQRAATSPSGKSTAPDLRAPINLGFRLRQLFGLGVRAEVMRILLTMDSPRADAAVITGAAAYARRNVVDSLGALADSGVVTAVLSGGEERYGVDRDRWGELLSFDGRPAVHVDWVQLLAGLGQILRWLRDPASVELSGYLAASRARDLVEAVRPDLEHAGLVIARRQTSAEALEDLDDIIRQALSLLR